LSAISFKNINKLAIPAIIAGIAEPLISLTDIAIIGNVDTNPIEALAAAGIVGSFLSAIIWIVAQTKTAISSIVSQHLGSNRIHAVKTLIPQAIFFNLLLKFFEILPDSKALVFVMYVLFFLVKLSILLLLLSSL
jgi:Na+-driven multidrug efflux pump